MSLGILSRQTFSTLEEVQEALAAEFPSNQLRTRQQWSFVPVERVRERLISVLGVDGFDISYSDVTHHPEDWITVTCTITADFTRWGGRIKSVTQADGIQIKRHSSGQNQGLIVDIGNDYKTVMSGSFTKAAQDLGVGLYLQFKNDNGGSNNSNYNRNNNNSNNNQQNQNNGGNSANFEKLKKTVYACEKTIGLDNQTKEKLLRSIIPNIQDIKNLNEQQLETYKKVLQPVSFIIQNVQKTNVNEQEVFNLLSQSFNRKISSYQGLLTLATMQTVNQLKEWLQQRAA